MSPRWYRQLHEPRPRTERGALLVEFALIVPMLVVLVVGGISTGLAYNTNNSLNNGARESARFAATLPVETSLAAWLNDVADVAIASTSGEMEATVPDQEVCVAYVYPDGTDSDDRTVAIVESGGSRLISMGAVCFADSRPDGERRVQVRLSRSAEIEAIAFNRDVALEATSIVRYERAP